MNYIDEFAHDEGESTVIDRAHLQRRVDDWLQRLTMLYENISA